MLTINSRRFFASLVKLNEFGLTSEGGISRICLSPSEVKARKYILQLMAEGGLLTTVDQVANIIGILGNTSPSKEIVMTGSHIDSVVNGGKLDGNLGVVAAIEAAGTLKEAGLRNSKPLGVVCFTNEEGVRFPPTTGSKYLAGLLELEEIYGMRDDRGITFREALELSKLEINETVPFLRKSNNVDSFVELHIEQGPVLEQDKIDIGIVDSIVGILQYEAHILGRADHAGTTPMIARSDALVAASKMVLKVNEIASEIGERAVGTVGRMEIMPGAPNVVPGEVNLVIDFRHSSKKVLDSFEREIHDLANSISKQTKTSIQMRRRAYLEPAIMSNKIMTIIEESVSELDLSSNRMQSGAGHDTMIINRICDCGMIFVPSIGGKSHSPIESTRKDDLINGANVLLNTLCKLVS